MTRPDTLPPVHPTHPYPRYLDPNTRVVNVESREVLLNAGNVHWCVVRWAGQRGGSRRQ